MVRLAETGAAWFCTAAHVVADVDVVTTTCGSDSSRYAIGLLTATAVFILGLFAAWRASESFR